MLALITEGKRNSEIGIILAISERTVEKHVGSILYKLGVETRTAAVGWSLRREFRAHLASIAPDDGPNPSCPPA